ncbi:MAG: pyruvate ferredoxin oxidoreductase [Dehalococcoidia bacterium]
MGKPVALNGNRAVAEAMRQMNPDVVAAYPITPQTEIVQAFSEFVANGEVDTEFVPVESEHAAMSVCIGACAAGGRAQTATAGAGLALMWEVLWVASGTRLPIVMHVVNRSFSAPLNILCDHSDSMGARDAGWVQLYDETVQEGYDNAIQSVRIAEHPDVMLPTLHALDGFILGHNLERLELLPVETVRQFVGTYKPMYSLLDLDRPVTYGPMDYHDYFFEHKRQQVAAMERALEVIPQIGEEYGRLSGRYYGLMEGYRLEDAELATVVLGSTAGTARVVVDELRDQGVKAGLLKVRCFRPFPAAMVAEALGDKKAIAVLDRSLSFGGQGNPLFLEVCTALFSHGFSPKVVNYVFGLGGRDTVPAQIRQVYQELIEIDREGLTGPRLRYLGIRE